MFRSRCRPSKRCVGAVRPAPLQHTGRRRPCSFRRARAIVHPPRAGRLQQRTARSWTRSRRRCSARTGSTGRAAQARGQVAGVHDVGTSNRPACRRAERQVRAPHPRSTRGAARHTQHGSLHRTPCLGTSRCTDFDDCPDRSSRADRALPRCSAHMAMTVKPSAPARRWHRWWSSTETNFQVRGRWKRRRSPPIRWRRKRRRYGCRGGLAGQSRLPGAAPLGRPRMP